MHHIKININSSINLFFFSLSFLENVKCSVELTSFQKHTCMVFGAVLDILHESGAELTARDGRVELYYRLFTSRTPVRICFCLFACFCLFNFKMFDF